LNQSKVKSNFVRLTEAQILIRCEKVSWEEDAPSPNFDAEPDPFLMPDVILDAAQEEEMEEDEEEPPQHSGMSTNGNNIGEGL
jgi:hypothetical protein